MEESELIIIKNLPLRFTEIAWTQYNLRQKRKNKFLKQKPKFEQQRDPQTGWHTFQSAIIDGDTYRIYRGQRGTNAEGWWIHSSTMKDLGIDPGKRRSDFLAYKKPDAVKKLLELIWDKKYSKPQETPKKEKIKKPQETPKKEKIKKPQETPKEEQTPQQKLKNKFLKQRPKFEKHTTDTAYTYETTHIEGNSYGITKIARGKSGEGWYVTWPTQRKLGLGEDRFLAKKKPDAVKKLLELIWDKKYPKPQELPIDQALKILKKESATLNNGKVHKNDRGEIVLYYEIDDMDIDDFAPNHEGYDDAMYSWLERGVKWVVGILKNYKFTISSDYDQYGGVTFTIKI